jgi:hypothetical protein
VGEICPGGDSAEATEQMRYVLPSQTYFHADNVG